MAYLLHGSKEAAGKQVVRMFESDPVKGEALLHELCDHLFDPTKPYMKDVIDWIKVLFGEHAGYEAICNKIRSLDSSSLCGCVWTAQFIAYRCRTCATSPCMSLCAACFENGKHEGHDYNIFRSEAGGACDCGDSSVMHKSGFCSHHGPNRVIPSAPPPGFLAAGKVLLERMFLAVIHLLRNRSTYDDSEAPLPALFSQFLEFILDLIKLGSPVRSHVSKVLLNEALYANLKECKGYKCFEDENSSFHSFHKQSNVWLLELLEGMVAPPVVSGIKDTGQFARAFQYKNYLDEITFWIVRFMFPEPLILIVLNLLPNAEMKREFSRCFARHYTRIADSLSKTAELDSLSNRVVHISVQLFSNDDIAYMLCTEENLLQIFMISMHNIIAPSLTPSNSHPGDMHQCVSCTSNVMRANIYWPIVSDLVNVLGHEKVAKLFLSDPDLMQCWFQEVLCFCGMALNKRALDSHVEFEPDHNQMLIAFYTERESCASPLWCMLAALQNPSSLEMSFSVIHSLLDTLQDLFDALGLTETSSLPFDQISFHYPLHRYLAHFISNAIKKQGAAIQDISVSEVAARTLILHPLQVLMATFEVQCAMWVRNGLYMASQSLAHRQYFFSKFFIDADLFLVQFCASILPPHYVIALIFERCRVLSCLTISDIPVVSQHIYPHDGGKGEAVEDKLMKMLEAAFHIVQNIIAINCMKDNDADARDEELMRSEMVTLLATKPSTFSSLTDHTPQSHESHMGKKSEDYINMLHRILDTYAAKKEGDAMEQTKYVANSEAWKLYDPVFSQYRSLYQRDVQKAHANYVASLQESGSLDASVSETALWPPYLPIDNLPTKYQSLHGLLKSKLLHALIFIVLHNEATLTDATIAKALHLLESALRLSTNDSSASEVRDEVFDQTWCTPLLKWYDVNDPVINMTKVVWFEKPTVPDVKHVIDNSCAIANVVHTTDCIASLLIKLYDKISGKKGAFVLSVDELSTCSQESAPPTRLNVISRILHIAASKSKDAEQTIQVICKSLAPLPLPSDPHRSSDSPINDRESRRRKARSAQERLMKQFALKQKQFLESAENMDVTESDSGTSVDPITLDADILDPCDWGLESFPQYECVICSSVEVELQASHFHQKQSSHKLMGLICLIQPSFVLGHRTTRDVRSSPYRPGKRPSNYDSRICRSHVLKRSHSWQSLVASGKLNEDLFSEQNLLANAIGSHVSTCGHYVHLSCHSQYMESVRNQGRSQLSYDMVRAFQCPLCRQVSNLVLPCNIRAKQRNTSRIPDYRAPISKAWLDTLSDITYINESDTLGAMMSRASRGLGLAVPLASLIRYNMEVMLMNSDTGQPRIGEGVGPSTRLTLQRKSPIGTLFILLHWMTQIGDAKEVREKKSALVGRALERLCGSEVAELQLRDTPLLLQDPITLLIQLVLESPLLLEEFQANVRHVYNLVFVQALLDVSCKFSTEERRAWKNNISVSLGGIPFSPESLECLVGTLIHLLPNQLFETPVSLYPSDPMDGTYLETVFTSQSVYGGIEKILLNFLRLSSILQQQLFPHKIFPPGSFSDLEFAPLASYLGLCPETEVTTVDIIKCLSWNNAKTVMTKWCAEVSDLVQHHQTVTRLLLCDQQFWKTPKLIDLPNEYSTLFQMYRLKPCHNCGSTPKDPSVCLICGEYLCYKGMCAKMDEEVGDQLLTPLAMQSFGNQSRTLFACSRHARRCGAGTCILLLINSSYIVIVRGSRICMWGTLYLDSHGEEDRGWRRGKPLFLKKQRLELLEQQWRRHMFDNTTKDWSAHRNSV